MSTATAAVLQLGAGSAAPRFSTVFQSHMVLQRGQLLKVWGFDAGPATPPSISIGGGAPSLATIAEDGRWEASFPAFPASATGVDVVLMQGGAAVQTLADVVFGDLYLFSGQSNIDISSCYAHQFNQTAMAEEAAFAEEMGRSGMLRIMIVPNQVPGIHYNQHHPAAELPAVPDCPPCKPFFGPAGFNNCFCNALAWTRSTNFSATAAGFSATAWYTGKALRAAVPALAGVPVGLIRSSWGGTPIQAWSSPDAVAKCPHPTPVGDSAYTYVIQ